MAGQVNVNPEALEDFVARLRLFQTDSRDLLAALGGNYAALCETWADEEQQKFDEVFQEFSHSFERFVETIDEAGPHLLRKAEFLRSYQGN
jgi:WXG100 family type VII secretion target